MSVNDKLCHKTGRRLSLRPLQRSTCPSPSFIKLALKSLRDVNQGNTDFLHMLSLKQTICRTFFFPMKFSITTWQKPSNRGEQLPQSTPSISDQRTSPNLPFEIWRRIIAFTIRLAGSTSIDLDDPFSPPYQNEEHPEVDPALFEDRKALRLVCSSWRSVVTEISAEYLIIYSAKELKALVKQFEAQNRSKTIGKRLGEWTTRIDCRILGHYSVSHITRLLRCTPNLLIYDIRNGPPDIPEKCTPIEVLKGLVANCSKLQRLGWSGAGETPRYQDLVLVCNGLPNLVTLRLASIFSFPVRSEGVPPMLMFPKLKTLSLAVIPGPDPPDTRPEYAMTWDPFMLYLSVQSRQLPDLQRLECDIFPMLTMGFFHMHGHKIRSFRTTAWSADGILAEALPLFSNLESFVISQGSESLIEFPIYHPTIQKICIIPSIEADVEVPPRVFSVAVMTPLDTVLQSLEKMTAPRLNELRIRNIGSFSSIIDYNVWLRFWWRRWNIRGVRFLDKSGVSYHEVYDRMCFFFFFPP